MYSNQGNVGTVVAGKCHYCNQPWVREGLCCMESSRGTMREGLGNGGASNSTSFAALMDAGLTPITNPSFIFIRRQRICRKVERIRINKYTRTRGPTHTHTHAHLANNNAAGKKVKERKESPPCSPPTHL